MEGWGSVVFLSVLFAFVGGIMFAAGYLVQRYSRYAWVLLITYSLFGIVACVLAAITGSIRWEYRALIGLGILPCLYSLRVLLSRGVRSRALTRDVAEPVGPGRERVGWRGFLLLPAALLIQTLLFIDDITSLPPMALRATILAALFGAALMPLPFLYLRKTPASKILGVVGINCGMVYFLAKMDTFGESWLGLLDLPVFVFTAGVVLALAVFHMAVHAFSKGTDPTGFGYTMLVLAPAILCSGHAASGDIGLGIMVLTTFGAGFLYELYVSGLPEGQDVARSAQDGQRWLRLGHAAMVGVYLTWELSLSIMLAPASLVALGAVQIWGWRQRVDGVGILSVGVVAYLLTSLWSLLAQELHGSLAFLYGTVVFTGSMSVFIARRFVHTLADNARKTQELEEARRLQLSLLPVHRPAMATLDVAWQMLTATEVGGDYYDYSISDDGTLTLCIGDATGHGMDAGVVVTGTKSLFQTFADAPSITDSLTVMSRSLKGMNLPRMGMAMTFLRLKDTTCTVSSAGMPPTMVYRAATGEVGEMELAGFPLGLSSSAQYQEETFEVSPGDVILMMSDGLPERSNPQDEYFDYDRTKALFAKVAGGTPEEICEALFRGGDEWAEGRTQDDDITLVVLKAK